MTSITRRLALVTGFLLLMTACGNQVDQTIATQPDKSDLNILYVGTDPAKPLSEGDLIRSPGDPDRAAQLRKTRAPDFEAFLKQYFDSVNVVYGDDYQEAMSADYDVTIIDAYLPVLSGGMKTDPQTGETTYERRKFLSEGYDHATVMIGEPSAFIGEGRELKVDHLCLCLDAHAHGMKLDHPIFNTPYKVDITYEERKTAGNYKARYSGRDLGNTMPMWRMQTEGYHDGKGFPIGLVSTGYGFDNGIDAEWISSGRCDKGVEAAAIGRHANFFHWGFAAAPEYMTDSARLAFINAIHYIAPFNGAEQVTRKIKSLPLRESLRERQWMVSDRGSSAWLAYLDEARQKRLEGKKALQARKAAGETLSDREEMMLGMEDKPETRAWTIKYEPQALKDRFGEDWAAYEKYYIENMNYFYPVPFRHYYQSAVDQDARSLGIANNSVSLLDKAVEMLQKGDRTEMANRLLTRYTNESFANPEEWAAWLGKNRSKLYFSEGDGYKFIVVPK